MWTMWKGLRALPIAIAFATVGVATTACAAQFYDYRGGQYRDYQRRAYDDGYRSGLKDGEKDARKNKDFSPSRHDEYRDVNDRWDDNQGSRQAYRQGFEVGYREGYQRYARNSGWYPPPYRNGSPGWPSGAVYRSPAADVGYRDGFEAGADDARDHDRYDPIGEKRYRSADHEYNSRYGSKEEYKREYRAAFQQGYDQGFRGFGYRR